MVVVRGQLISRRREFALYTTDAPRHGDLREVKWRFLMDAFVTRRTDVAATELERPSKRVKREISDSEDDEPIWEHKELNDDIDQRHGRATDFENALPDAPGEAEAEYEAIKSSQEVKAPALWVRGRSSIYVDAFNLALDTVLEEESHLFDEQEKDVFRQWRELDYEAQYL